MTMHRELRPCELVRLETFRPRCVRRDWKATLWTALLFLALSALAGYLWACVKHAATVSWRTGSTMLPLAVISPIQGAGIVVCILVALLVAWACRQQRREDAEQENIERKLTQPSGGRVTPSKVSPPPVTGLTAGTGVTADAFTVGPLESLPEVAFLPLREPDQATVRLMNHLWKVAGLADLSLSDSSLADPLALPTEGLTPEETARILKAIAAELKLTRTLVQGAQRSIGAEDYGDALDGAERRLGLLRTTVLELRAKFKPDVESGVEA